MKRIIAPLRLVFAIILSGCATAVIHDARVSSGVNLAAESGIVYVKDFDTSRAVFKGDYSDVPQRVAEERARIPDIITREIIDDLAKKGRRAVRYDRGAGSAGLIVDGVVTQVDSGSGAARFWVGMGAGSSKVLANVRVYRASNVSAPVASLEIEGHSGGTGGAFGYQDWIGANCKDIALKIGEFLCGKM